MEALLNFCVCHPKSKLSLELMQEECYLFIFIHAAKKTKIIPEPVKVGSQTENIKWKLGKFETESHWSYTYRQFHLFRLGGGPNDYKDVIEHKFFESINFDDLLAKRVRNFLTI